MNEQSNTNKIEAYLMDAMHENERLDFERQLQDDPALAAELRRHQKLIEGVEYFGVEKFKNRLRNIHEEVITTEDAPARPSKSGRLLALLAAVLLLLLLALWLFRPSDPPSPAQIYADNFQRYDLVDPTRSPTQSFRLAKEAYANGDFVAALTALEELLEQDPDNLSLLLGAGNCLLELGEPARAISYLQRALAADDLLYKDTARWYLAMAWLQSDQPDKARPLLGQLAARSESSYQSRAREILRQLKR